MVPSGRHRKLNIHAKSAGLDIPTVRLTAANHGWVTCQHWPDYGV